MKKFGVIFLICVLILILGIAIRFCFIKKVGEEHIACINEELLDYEKSIEGMTVIMFGGSNQENKGNVNSMGYLIKTKNNEVILIDGGRNFDTDLVKFFIDKYGNGKVDHWFITHAHSDHVGAICDLIKQENNLQIENIYVSLLSDEWYKEHDKRGYESEHAFLESLSSNKIKNIVNCQEGQVIKIDNIRCDIIRVANPEITNSDNGNEASMVFKVTAEDVNKSMIFLGDAMKKASEELLNDHKNQLKADAVQMAHHGQNGVTKEVYDAIDPDVCFYNSPKWLWNNDNGGGENSGSWQTLIVRNEWLKDKGVTNYVAFEGDQTVRFTSEGLIEVEE